MELSKLDAPLVDPKGKPVTTSPDDKSPFTVRDALISALLADIPPTQGTPGNGSTKLKRYDLFVQLRANRNSFSIEDIAILKATALEVCITLFAGQIVAALESEGPK